MAQFAQVIVDIAHQDVDHVFDYAVPAALDGRVVPGSRVTVPFGPRRVEGYVMALADTPSVAPERVRPIAAVLDELPPLRPALLDLAFWLSGELQCRMVDVLRVMLPAQMRGNRVREKLVRHACLSVSPAQAQQALSGLPERAGRQRSTLCYLMEKGGEAETGDLAREAGADGAVLAALHKKGLVRVEQRVVRRTPYEQLEKQTDRPQANGPQRQAIDRISEAIARRSGVFLLHGVTGSGKTEVYMQCAQSVLTRGGSVIILVPEISLTPQMVARFTGRFGEQAAVLHSRLSAGERYDQWLRIRRGQARVVIGARSAVFAPVGDLGLIVIDEEHETSYRSENTPRYDAVAVARQRCAAENAVLVLGSATPSIDRYYAATRGEYQLITLPTRIEGRPMPRVEVVDLRREMAAGNHTMLSGRLTRALKECVARSEQAILFLNRRGHSHFVSCRSCGYVCRCELCDLSMTFHHDSSLLQCHYCGRTEPSPATCPQCGSPHIRFFGGGTQKLEQQVRQLLGDVPTLRMDADSTQGKEGHLRILEAFRKGQAPILIGTQMIAKGLDFPMVTLVGVVAADLSLNLPDWRSAERTFQLVLQVAGRAGRDKRPGQVIVQSYSPDHYSILAAARHDYEAFYRQEITLREGNEFPPFTRFMRVVFSNEDEAAARDDAALAAKSLREQVDAHPAWQTSVLMLEHTPAPVARIRAQYRQQLLLKVYPQRYGGELLAALQQAAQKTPRGSNAAVEIDPPSML